MDAVSVVGVIGSVFGVSDIVARSLKGLVGLQTVYRSADLVITIAIGHLHTVEAILCEICDWLKGLHNASEYTCLLANIDMAVGCCAVIAEALFEKINALQDNPEPSPLRKGRLLLLLGEGEIKGLNTHLETQIRALHMLLDAARSKSPTGRQGLPRDAKTRSMLKQIQEDSTSYIYASSGTVPSSTHQADASEQNDATWSTSERDPTVPISQVYRNAFKNVIERRQARGMKRTAQRSHSESPASRRNPQPMADKTSDRETSREPDGNRKRATTLSDVQELASELAYSPGHETIMSKETLRLHQYSWLDNERKDGRSWPLLSIVSEPPSMGDFDNEVHEDDDNDEFFYDDDDDDDDDENDEIFYDDETINSGLDAPWPLMPQLEARRSSELPKAQPEPQPKEVQATTIGLPPSRSNSSGRVTRRRGLSDLLKLMTRSEESVEARASRLRNEEIERNLKNEQRMQLNEKRIFISGKSEGGRSTVLEYFTLLADTTFTDEERKSYCKIVRSSMIQGMRAVLEAMETLDIPLGNHDSKRHVETIFATSPQTQEDVFLTRLGEAMIELRDDPGVQACIERGQEYDLDDCVPFYLASIERIAKLGYLPTNEDILRSKAKATGGIRETVFMLKDQRYRIFDVGRNRGERRKWASHFDNVTSVVFTVDISNYDELPFEDETTNKIDEQIALFEETISSRWFKGKSIILLFTKGDQLKAKLPRSPMSRYFSDYDGSTYEDATEYLLRRFVSRNQDATRSVYTFFWDTISPFPYEMLLFT